MRRRAGFTGVACVLALLAAFAAGAGGVTAPAFSKVFETASIGPGSTSTLVYLIDSSGIVSPVTDLAFQDDLPANVVISTPSRLATTCVEATVTGAPGGSTITLSQGRLGVASRCMVSVDVTSSVVGVYMSTSGDLTSSGGVSGPALATLTVDLSLPGFGLAFAPATIPVGALSRLTLTIDNTGGATDLAPISFAATLPSGLAIASPPNAFTDCSSSAQPATLTAAAGSRTISLVANGLLPSFPVLASGGTCVVSVDVEASVAGALDVSTNDLNVNNGLTAGKAVGRLDVLRKELQKLFIGDPVLPGETVQLEYTLTNLDRFDSASSITFTDDLDAALSGLALIGSPPMAPCGPASVVFGTSLVSFAGGALGPGESCTFSLTLMLPVAAAPGDYLSTTSSASLQSGGQAGAWDPGSDRLRVVDQPFSFTKVFTTSPIGAGGTATVQFSITNESSMDSATDIRFVDELAPPFSFPISFVPFPSDPCGTGSLLAAVFPGTDRQGLELTAGMLPPGGICQFEASFEVPIDTPSASFEVSTEPITATVAGSPVSGDSATGTIVVVGAPLAFRAEFTDDPVGPLETVTLEFTLSNDSEAGDAITGLAFADDLSATLPGLFATALPAGGFCGPSSQMTGTTTLSVSGVSLAAGQSCSFAATLTVPVGATPGGFQNTTSVVNASVNGIAVSSPPAESELRIRGPELSMRFVDDPVVPGATVVLEYTIANAGVNIDATDIFFTHDLSATLNGLAPSASLPGTPCGPASSLSSGGSLLILQGGSLSPGAMCTFSVTLVVPALAVPNTYPSVTSQLNATLGATVVLPGAFDVLTVAFAPNDVCSESTIVDGVPVLAFGDIQDTTLATSDGGDPTPGCGLGADGATVWYSFVATDDRTIRVSTEGSSYDTVVSVWQGTEADCGALTTEVACNDDLDVGIPASLAQFDPVAGTTYLIQVGDRNSGPGGDLVVSIPEPGGWWLSVSALAALYCLRRRSGSRGRPRAPAAVRGRPALP